ncbi:MAG: adenosine kinase [Chlamydiota bacterium]
MTQSEKYDIIGIGAAVVDHIITVDEEYVSSLEGGKGGMVPVSYQTLSKILDHFDGEATLMAGGSASNTIKGLANFGNRCAFMGKIGRDVTGHTFVESIKDLGIVPILHHSNTPTAHALSLVTPDGERTMRTYLGASEEMCSDDLDPSIFKGVKLVHLEGYNLLKGDLPEKAIALAKQNGAKVSLDLASYEIVNLHKERILEIIRSSVDIVIANADEAWALFGLPPEKSCHLLKNLCEISIVLFGEGGCWVGCDEEVIHGAPFPTHPVDSTGAGDLFASGFLNAYLKGSPLQECARLGNLAGSAVVQVLGAEIPPLGWKKIKSTVLT